jgi:hypothetical protein
VKSYESARRVCIQYVCAHNRCALDRVVFCDVPCVTQVIVTQDCQIEGGKITMEHCKILGDDGVVRIGGEKLWEVVFRVYSLFARRSRVAVITSPA